MLLIKFPAEDSGGALDRSRASQRSSGALEEFELDSGHG